MTADEVERRISELSGRLTGLVDGSDEQRATRAELAAALAVRYVRHGGADSDRVRATELADLVQADPASTDGQRDRMSQLALTLTMVGRTPAEALRDHPTPDLDAVLRTTEWVARTGPEGLRAGVDEMRDRLSALTGAASLPPDIRTLFDLMSPLADLMGSGAANPSEATVAKLNEVLDGAPQTGNPGIELLRAFMPMIAPAAEPAGQADRLRQQLAGLPEDHMLTPMLRADLATLLVGGAGLEDLREAAELLKQAASVPEEHPLSDSIRRQLAGALLASAAAEATPDRIAQAQEVVDQVLARTGDAGPARPGADLLLRSMLAILRGTWGDPGQTAVGVTDLLEAVRILPADDDLHAVAVGLVGGVLADRHLVKGLLDDADTAALLLDKAAASAGDDPVGGSAVIATLAASIDVSRALRTADDVGLAVAAERLDEATARLPAAHVVRPSAELMSGVAGLRLALTGAKNVRESVGDLHARLTGGPVPGHSADMLAVMADTASAFAGALDGEPAEVLAGIERLEARLDRITLPQHQATVRALLGLAYLTAHERGIGPADAASRAVTHLEQARQSADGVEVIEVLRALARACRAAGQSELACRHGFAALEEQAGLVLLQTGVGHAVLTARGAAADAAILAEWCLAADDADAALRAIELGRGLALHAATSTLEVPAMLRELGHPDLAEAWADHTREGRPATDPEVVTSGGLRHRVLAVLRESSVGSGLFVAPPMAAVAGELAGNDIDALVYVVPGTEGAPGRLLGVARDGRPIIRELPDLVMRSDGPLAEFIAADQNTPAEWKAALEALCDWAGTAVLSTVLEAVGRGRRVVLVPLGELGVVSWPAARLGESRFGCTELILSTAASARQFLDSVRRPAQPIGRAPVLVTDPRGNLGFAAEEALVLHDVFYPGALLLGDLHGFESDVDGAPLPEALPATPVAFLAHVPGADTAGASLLHLSCHAKVGNAAEASRLVLTEDLPIETVLRHAARREPDNPGGTVVLTSCSSDLTAVDYDEALTLATAFLAAGAVTVIGSRWETGDRGTAVLMFAVHHFLVRRRLRPAEALRAAQLWMLDPAREPLADLPDAMIGDLALPETTDVTIWGAFTHHGR
jgi:hypothetical protein